MNACDIQVTVGKGRDLSTDRDSATATVAAANTVLQPAPVHAL